MFSILDPDHRDQPFPPVREALAEPNGLLAVGGCLSPPRLLNAYRSGIFPWYSVGEPILWWSPDPRWVLFPEDVRVSRSLARRLRRGEFQFTHDRAFRQVITACARPRDPGGTWITEDMLTAYLDLHRLGWAHSFEAWRDGELAGGLYGVAIGRAFFGESMFHRVTDASKAAFVSGCRRLHDWGYQMVDCQVHTAHLESLGARRLSRGDFIQRLRELCEQAPREESWLPTDIDPPVTGSLAS